MNERLTTRSLADQLAKQSGLEKKRAEEFIDAIASYFAQGIEKNKGVKILGLGTFKVLLVRERESVHIKTGERFVIPAHHKLTFVPDKDFKEQANRPFAFFEPIEATESDIANFKAQNNTQEKNSDNLFIKAENDIKKPPLSDSSADEPVFDDILPVSNSYMEDNEFDENEFDFDIVNEEMIFEVDETPEQESENETLIFEETLSKQEPLIEETFAEQESSSEEVFAESEEVLPKQEPLIEETFAEQESLLADAVLLPQTEPQNGKIQDFSVIEKTLPVPEKKKKRNISPVLIMNVLIPICVLLGMAIGTYYFLQKNRGDTPRTEQSVNNLDDAVEIGSEQFSVETGTDYDESDNSINNESNETPIRGNEPSETSIRGNESNNLAAPSDANNTSSTTSPNNSNNTRAEAGWIAPSPENSSVPRTRRVDNPSRQTDERNRANNSRQTTTTSNTNTTRGTATTTTPTTRNNRTFPKSVRMQAGSTLTQLALEHYDNKVFWVYIYEHNKSRIKDPDKVPSETELVLPPPGQYGIDANNNSSLQRAAQKQAEIQRQLKSGVP